jgi:septum formation protein
MIRLGSNSATRALLLKQHDIAFIQNGGNFDEDSITTKDPKEFVTQAVKGKFEELYKKYGCDEMPLLVADTVVTSNSELLRKAKDQEDARRMLMLQSNNEVSIITCMIFKSIDTELFDISTTTYHFKEFNKEHMEQYIQSGECMGKAGAIMVEGFCKPYIQRVEGYESTAMGLCVEKLLPFVK